MKTKDYSEIAQIFKVLSNPKRLEILNTIRDKEVTVNELSKILGIRKANSSQHLSVLRYLGLVTLRREGKHIFYKAKNSNFLDSIKFIKKFEGR